MVFGIFICYSILLLEAKVKYCNLAISDQCCISYKNQTFHLLYKWNGWFLFEMQHWVEMAYADRIKICKTAQDC